MSKLTPIPSYLPFCYGATGCVCVCKLLQRGNIDVPITQCSCDNNMQQLFMNSLELLMPKTL